MNNIRGFKENGREAHIRKFGYTATISQDLITYDGETFIRIRKNRKLPKGFQARLLQHIFDMLTAKRTAIWDEQAVYGERLPIRDDYEEAVKRRQPPEGV